MKAIRKALHIPKATTVYFDGRFEFLLGFLAIMGGLAFFTDPASLASSAVGRALPGIIDDVWNLFYIFGGLGICVGLLIYNKGVEAFGLWLLCSGMLVNTVVIFSIRGLAGLAVMGPIIIASWACAFRLNDLRKMPTQ